LPLTRRRESTNSCRERGKAAEEDEQMKSCEVIKVVA
jgi:hypothetical protein